MDSVSQELLTRLLGEHGTRLVLYAQQWCSTPQDVVQEAYIRLMRQRPAPSCPTAWLYRVVRNGAISASRSEARRTQHEATAAGRREAWFTPSSAEQIDATSAVEALKSLPIAQRETIVLRLWSELSFEQIAELTETSISTAHRRYGEALAAMQDKLRVPRSP
jgi:RNA polymerase sigma factor (sigma-70 family)